MPRPPEAIARYHTPSSVGLILDHVSSGLILALFFVRFFLPAEATAQGDTLWIVLLWFVCGLVWIGRAISMNKPSRPLDWADLALAACVGSQLLSACAIVLGVGDKRAAINVAWEWAGIGLIWLVTRQALRTPAFQYSLIQGLIVTGITVSLLGLHQHYISQPQMVAEYGPLFDQLRTGTAGQAAVARNRLARDGVPTEGPALTLFEKRLRDSREPLGLYALANTFGGCLAVCLILTIGELWGLMQRRASWYAVLPMAGAVATVGWCLLLTKSRTAWIGTAVGFAILFAPQLRFTKRQRMIFLGGTALALVVIGLLMRFGGLDRQVLSEAPKSLAYRLQYWQATSQMIADHPWLGVGPGNFRQHYLKYKLPQASEEISDPHNMFFELAATAGIGSAIGMAFFLAVAVYRSMIGDAAETESGKQPTVRGEDSAQPDRLMFWWAALGAPLAFAALMGLAGEWEDRIVFLSIIWLLLAALLRVAGCFSAGCSQSPTTAPLAALVALTIHLQGAGGIAMPGICELLIGMAAICVSRSMKSSPAPAPIAPIALAVVSFIGAGFLVTTALRPVLASREWMRQAEIELTSGRQSRDAARNAYHQAAESDRFSPEPWRHLFELSRSGEKQSNESFDLSVKELQEVMARDPYNFWGPRSLGELWLSRWEADHQREDAEQAVKWLRRANQLYPTNSEILSKLAMALTSAGEMAEATVVAKSALAQDEIYHKMGHVDRYLPDSVLLRLRKIADEAVLSPTP